MEQQINAKAVPEFPPLRETGLTVLGLLSRGPEWWSKGAKYRNNRGVAIDIDDAANPPASFDITGAIDYCYSNQRQNLEARVRLGLLLRTTATRWNDAPGRTWEEVLELARKAGI